MDISALLVMLFALAYIGAVLYIANQQEAARAQFPAAEGAASLPADIDFRQRDTILRWLLYGVAALVLVYNLFILQLALFESASVGLTAELQQELPLELPSVDPLAAAASFALGAAVCFLCVQVTNSASLRARLAAFIGARGVYNPQSSVHTAAIVLSLAIFSATIGQLVLSGGLDGLAQNVENLGVSPGELVFQGALMVAAALLGVGLAIRRPLPQTLDRLGLRLPTPADVGWGVGIGLLLYGALIVMFTLWTLFVPIEQISQQSAAAEQIAQAFRTLPLAFLLAATSAVSEEILFRGALQPVFGLWLTSVFFALLHMQYTLTPATLIIFVVALGLGWLRRRQSTTAAIFAHFVYNFVIQAFAILAAGAAGV